MKYKFEIIKHVPASMSNVIANYLDLEHVPIHSGLFAGEVISETENSAVFFMSARVFGITLRNVHYFEFRPPSVILQVVKTPLGPLTVHARTREFNSGTPAVRCETTVSGMLELPLFLWPFRALIGRAMYHQDMKVKNEDMVIWERRQRLLGDYIEDYLRADQQILFKELFRKHYSKGAVRHPLAGT